MIGYTLLMHACDCEKADVAVFLIKSGAEVNTKSRMVLCKIILLPYRIFCILQLQNGASPLSLAADKGLTEVVELLIEKDVDINETGRVSFNLLL